MEQNKPSKVCITCARVGVHYKFSSSDLDKLQFESLFVLHTGNS